MTTRETLAPPRGGLTTLRAPIAEPGREPDDAERRLEDWLVGNLEGTSTPTAAGSEWHALIPELAGLSRRRPAAPEADDPAGPGGWHRIKVQERRGVTVVQVIVPSLTRENDLAEFAEELRALTDAGHSRLILDFAAVERLSSQILGTVLATHARCVAEDGGRLVVCGLHPGLARLFEIADVAGRVPVVADLAAALETPWPEPPNPRPLPVEVVAELVRRPPSREAADTRPAPAPLPIGEPSTVWLVPSAGPSAGRPVPLEARPVRIGRDPVCEIVADCLSMSRLHAVVERRHGRAWVRDLGSTNGTRLNGEPVDGGPVPLSQGDRIEVGSLAIEVALGDRPADVESCIADWLADEPAGDPEDLDATLDSIPVVDPAASNAVFRYEVVDDVLVVTPKVADLVEASTIDALRDGLLELFEQRAPRRVVLNLDCVSTLSGRAIGMLLAHSIRLDRAGGALRLCQAHARARAVVDRVRLPMLVPCFATLDDAVLERW